VVWSYLLGPSGALLAIPLTIAVRRVLQDPARSEGAEGLGLDRSTA
jgi:predicted PurR-regulated permease PerM